LSRDNRRRVLFVCTGNICRSPLAEAVFKKHVAARGLSARYGADSAGTHGWHEGDPADPRTIRVGERHGIDVDSIARALADRDFEEFDVIVAMDRGHLRAMRAACPPALSEKLRLMRDYDDEGTGRDVPDPYYGGFSGFEDVYSMLDRSCGALLDALEAETPATGSAGRAGSRPRG